MKRKNIIALFLCISTILVITAFITVANSFSLTETKTTIFDASINSINEYTNNIIDPRIQSNVLTFNIPVNNLSTNESINFNLYNGGSYNAILNKIDVSGLDNVIVGVSNTTGKTYYASDFITYNIKDKDGDSLNTGDKLAIGENKSATIVISYKDAAYLNEDEKSVINSSNSSINMKVIFDYQQEK